MAKLRKEELIAVTIDALRAGGLSVNRLTAEGLHPADLEIWDPQGVPRLLRVYIWNISHGGGRARAANEYRIQVTPISQFERLLGGDVIILGWFEELGVFAAYDFRFHAGPLGNSPSIQIGKNALSLAAENGLAPYARGNGELAIAVRADMLAVYVKHMHELHDLGGDDAAFRAFLEVSANPSVVNRVSAVLVPEPRRRVLVTAARLMRDADFRERVLTAYGHACAFCGVQLELLDAAHILPVNHADSTDEIDNGVALCSLHHRAYDRSLITFDIHYRIYVDEARMGRLRMRHRSNGERDFKMALRSHILLPEQVFHRPRRDLIVAANQLRGWHVD